MKGEGRREEGGRELCLVYQKKSFMSGHSKWSTIKRKKGAQDAKRSKLFGRLAKEISVAVKEGINDDPSANPRLRLALQNARSANMPKDNIEKAMKRGKNIDAATYHAPVYEGYAQGGIGIYVECLTDNLNRTLSQVRHLFSKHEGRLITSGSLDFLFVRKGFFVLEAVNIEADESKMLSLIEVGVEEVLTEKGEDEEPTSILIGPYTSFGDIQKQIEALGLDIAEAGLKRIAKEALVVPEAQALRVQRLIDAFMEEDDVQSVFHNMAIKGV